MRTAPNAPALTASAETLAAEISRLARLPAVELRDAWRTEFRRDPPKTFWRELLLRTLLADRTAWEEVVFESYADAPISYIEAAVLSAAGD